MPRLEPRLELDNYIGRYRQTQLIFDRRIEAAFLRATDKAATGAKNELREAMQSARLGRLGNAVGANSDLSRGDGVHRSATGFSASGVLFVRSKSERTLGALEAYTQGADIRPVRGRWLWVPTDEIQRLAGSGSKRRRLTPGNWDELGMESKIGTLVAIQGINGRPLFIVENVGVSALGKSRSARSLTKSGRPRKGQREKAFIVAFIGIPATSRTARVRVRPIAAAARDRLPQLINSSLEDTFR
jgi:hypothetical protein